MYSTSNIRQEVFKQMPNLDIPMVDFNRIVDATVELARVMGEVKHPADITSNPCVELTLNDLINKDEPPYRGFWYGPQVKETQARYKREE